MIIKYLKPRWLSASLALLIALTPVGQVLAANLSDNKGSLETKYVDVSDQAWYSEVVNKLIGLNLLQPRPGDHLSPNQLLTRGNFALMLASGLGMSPSESKSPFADVVEQPLASILALMKQTGIITGNDQGLFQPDELISRAEATAMLVRAMNLSLESEAAARFRDVPSDSWFAGTVGALVKADVIHGKSDVTFAPHDPITKVETLTLLYRAFYKVSVIDSFAADTVTIDGQLYTVDESLRGLFREANRAAMQGAYVTFKAKDEIVQEIKNLIVPVNRRSGSTNEVKIIYGGGATISGSLIAYSDRLVVSNLVIKDRFIHHSNQASELYVYRVYVEGESFLGGAVMHEESALGTVNLLRHTHIEHTDYVSKRLHDDDKTGYKTNMNIAIASVNPDVLRGINLSNASSNQDIQSRIKLDEIREDMENMAAGMTAEELVLLAIKVLSMDLPLYTPVYFDHTDDYMPAILARNIALLTDFNPDRQAMEELKRKRDALIDVTLGDGKYDLFLEEAAKGNIKADSQAYIRDLILWAGSMIQLDVSNQIQSGHIYLTENSSDITISGEASFALMTVHEDDGSSNSGSTDSGSTHSGFGVPKLGNGQLWIDNAIIIEDFIMKGSRPIEEVIAKKESLPNIQNINGKPNPQAGGQSNPPASSGSGNGGNSSPPPSPPAATVTSVTYANVTSLDVDLIVESSNATKLYYVVLFDDEAPVPTVDDVVRIGTDPNLGQTGSFVGYFEASGIAINPSPLVQIQLNLTYLLTKYTAYVVVENAPGQKSGVSSVSFTTQNQPISSGN